MRRRIYPFELAQKQALPFTVASVTGSPVSGVTSDHTAYPAAVHGYFNWRNVAIARAVCGPGDTIFDIGANIGTETVCFSDIVGPTGAVCAFEPFGPNVEQLRTNAASTRHLNVRVHAVALGDSEGELLFAIPPADNSGAGHALAVASAGTGEAVIEVPSTTLDALADELPSARLVTIDVEGHEDPILRGAERLLSEVRPVMVLEVIAQLLSRGQSSPEEIARRMRDHGYRLYEMTRFGLEMIGADIPQDSDWLAVPAEESDRLLAQVRRALRRAALLPVIQGLNPLARRG